MKRLDERTFDGFARSADVTAVLFVSPCGEASLDQALNFAAAWASGPHDAFGYVDTFDQIKLAKHWAIRVLPTTLIFRGGRIFARLEGRHFASRVLSSMDGARSVIERGPLASAFARASAST